VFEDAKKNGKMLKNGMEEVTVFFNDNLTKILKLEVKVEEAAVELPWGRTM